LRGHDCVRSLPPVTDRRALCAALLAAVLGAALAVVPRGDVAPAHASVAVDHGTHAPPLASAPPSLPATPHARAAPPIAIAAASAIPATSTSTLPLYLRDRVLRL